MGTPTQITRGDRPALSSISCVFIDVGEYLGDDADIKWFYTW